MSLPLRLAVRELRGGFAGLRLLALCLVLGVAALAGVGSLSSALLTGLAEQGQTILGGDVELSVSQRRATADELAAFRRLGTVSEVVRLRAMAARPDRSESLLAELKGVDDVWPLYGRFRTDPGRRPAAGEVAIGAELGERLRLGVGDSIRLGEAQLRISGIIADEPDRLGQGFTLGPAAIVDPAGLAATGLVQPGSLYTAAYRIRLPAGADVTAISERLSDEYRDAGYEVEDRTNGAPGTRRFIGRLGQFLTLIGLTALAVAGIGVGNGVSSYLEARRASLATLKLLGAETRTLFAAYALQIGIVAAAATLVGLAIGAAVPWIVLQFAGDALPVSPLLSLYPQPLALAAAYGLLVAAAFAILPLSRAGAIRAAALFRGDVADPGERATGRARLVAVGAAVLLTALAVGTAREPLFAAGFVAAAIGLLLLLAGIGWGVRTIAARAPRPRRPLARLALANVHRPGAQTTRLVTALGLGLALFATLAVIETSLSNQIRSAIPAKAPSFFLLDIPNAEVPRFRALAARHAGGDVVTIPSLRGTVVAMNDRRISELDEIPDGAWFLRGDRGLTYAADLPEGSRVVDGRWWPADYRGPPLISLDEEAATTLNLKIGDSMTVSVLGREIEAEIASLREINWDTYGFNFVIIFAPGALEAAPHSYMATVAMPDGAETSFARAVATSFPTVSAIRVKEVAATIAGVLDQMSVAIRAAAAVAILAGIAVLAGALAASRRSRTYDAVLLKLLGASRARILASQAIEFAGLALVVAGVALAIGAAAGWYVVVQLFELDWAVDWGTVLLTLGGGALLILVLSLLGTLPALRARPAQALRSL